MTLRGPVVFPPPYRENGEWFLALDPDGRTVTLAVIEEQRIVASEVREVEGGWAVERNPKRNTTLKEMAVAINSRGKYAEAIRNELFGVTVELVHVGNMEMWRHD